MSPDIHQHGVFLGRLILSVCLGGALGWERERKHKSAGIKTHILITVSGCLLMWLSSYSFTALIDHPNVRFDPARLAAQVGGGIGGFLAAGVVLRHDRFALSGYSTAAMLLMALIVGFAVGGGQYFVAIASVAVVITCMVFLPLLQRKIHQPLHRHLSYVAVNRPELLAEIATILGQNGISITQISMEEDEDDDEMVTTTLVVMAPPHFNWQNLMQNIQAVEKVISVNLE